MKFYLILTEAGLESPNAELKLGTNEPGNQKFDSERSFS
jgi:hypothetical protein